MRTGFLPESLDEALVEEPLLPLSLLLLPHAASDVPSTSTPATAGSSRRQLRTRSVDCLTNISPPPHPRRPEGLRTGSLNDPHPADCQATVCRAHARVLSRREHHLRACARCGSGGGLQALPHDLPERRAPQAALVEDVRAVDGRRRPARRGQRLEELRL